MALAAIVPWFCARWRVGWWKSEKNLGMQGAVSRKIVNFEATFT